MGRKKVYELMWQPLVIGKFGERYYKQVNMAWMWARLKARTTRLGTFEGGFQNFANLFADKLREMGVDIRLQTPVTSVSTGTRSQVKVNIVERDIQPFDKVLITLSPEVTSRLVPSLPEAYLHGLRTLKSMGAVVMVLALKHQLIRRKLLLVQPAKIRRLSFPGIGGAYQFCPAQISSVAITSSTWAIIWNPSTSISNSPRRSCWNASFRL